MTYQYRWIGAGFHQELFDLVADGKSAILLSLRHLGKRYAVRKLADRLITDRSHLILEIEFPHEPALLKASVLQEQVRLAVTKAAPDVDLEDIADNELLASVRLLCERQPGAVVLIASNVDSLAHHLARLFLREVRALASNPQNPLTAVLTGEENLRDLVCGKDSEFNCADQFVLQGFDEQGFVEYIGRRREIARIPFQDEKECLKLLWRQAGGNIHLARAALWGWLEMKARSDESTEKSLSTNEFEDFLVAFPVNEACGMDVFHQTTRVIARSPDAWRDLKNLKKSTTTCVPDGSPPHVVELAGLATRKMGVLRYASPIMERFAAWHFNACRIGDLYAVHGEWEEAFRCYADMTHEERLRPCGGDDVPRLALVIKALTGKLHAVATHKIEDQERKLEEAEAKLQKLKRVFTQGCQALLGVTGVTFWSHGAGWNPLDQQPLPPDVLTSSESLLRSAKLDELGWQHLGPELSKVGAVAVLPALRPDSRDAVVVIAGQRGVAISQERQEVLQEMLDQFTSAYDHCIANLGAEIRLKAREGHLRVATAIVGALGETVRNPRQALKAAGQELLKLGYRRIMFALVDPNRQQIRGISDCAGEGCPSVDIAKETEYLLTDPEQDIQSWVVVNKRTCVVDDWRTWNQRRSSLPKINDDLCRRAKHRYAFAVVPMFIRVRRADNTFEEEAFGTIHVERKDGRLPSKDDVDDLLEFGRQMAEAAHQAERFGVLLEALDSHQDAVVVFDDEALVRFANKSAAKRFDVPAGWHEAHEHIPINDPALTQDTHMVISSGKPLARHGTSLTAAQYRREAVFCTPLPDWRAEPSDRGDSRTRATIGAVLQARDLTLADKVFSALQKVAQRATNRETTIATVLKCVKELGYETARLYLVDLRDSDLLLSVRALGLDQAQTQTFKSGHYSMSRNDPERGDTWRCLETEEPCVHQWNSKAQDGSSITTMHGVTVYNLQAPKFRLPWKEEGDVWIDLPLLANKRPIGKLTIDCGKHLQCTLTPVEFDLLKLFSVLLGALLSALDKEQWVREAAEKAMATCSHNIRTKLAALDGFGDRYRRAAPDNLKVDEVNKLHEPTVKDCFLQVTRLRETFAGMQLQRVPTSLRPLLETTLDVMFGRDKAQTLVSWQVICPIDLTISLDPDRSRNALEALLENSRAMLPSDRLLELSVKAESFQREGSEWLRLSVLDNGPGVAPEECESIFEPFFSRRPGGKRSTGLGLAYVLRVVKAHGGTICVAEGRSSGAEFIIEIPNPSKP